jgi:hypothetical protein
MPGVERFGDPATCGHPNTGSTTVFVNGRGVTRVGIDVAGGLIVGPGNLTVFVEGFPVSMPGDLITTHGLPPHDVPVTANPSVDVFVG